MINTIVGNYKIQEMIGGGGMGTVYKGLEFMIEREVAIKVLRPELARHQDIVERFRAEAIALAKLIHPNIATLFNFLRQGNDFFMVMEYVPGITLEKLIRTKGGIPCEVAVPIFNQILDGIAHAHDLGIIHRDIKPGNIMITPAGKVKVMDFGIAKVLGGVSGLTREGRTIGTIEYMSPEQINGLPTDARSDIYSLGILLYEMLSGRVPFTGSSEYQVMRAHIEAPPLPLREVVPGLPTPVEQALMKALSKQQGDRFASAVEFKNSLIDRTGASDSAAALRATPGHSTTISLNRSEAVGGAEQNVSAGSQAIRTDELKMTRQAELTTAYPSQFDAGFGGDQTVGIGPQVARTDELKMTRQAEPLQPPGPQSPQLAPVEPPDQGKKELSTTLQKVDLRYYVAGAVLFILLVVVLLLSRGEKGSSPGGVSKTLASSPDGAATSAASPENRKPAPVQNKTPPLESGYPRDNDKSTMISPAEEERSAGTKGGSAEKKDERPKKAGPPSSRKSKPPDILQ